jgi:hypothetical protein
VLGVAALATLGIIFATSHDSAPEYHRDGLGPLGSVGDPAADEAIGFDPLIGGPTWSVGVQLCLAQGDQSAVLDGSVTSTKSVGGGIKYLGAFIRQFTPGQGATPIGSVEGFPPSTGAALHPVAGFVVDGRCQYTNPDRSLPYTELVIGFGRNADPSGGGWLGLDVGYTSGGHHYVVLLGYDFLICGPAAPSQYCHQPSQTPPPSA